MAVRGAHVRTRVRTSTHTRLRAQADELAGEHENAAEEREHTHKREMEGDEKQRKRHDARERARLAENRQKDVKRTFRQLVEEARRRELAGQEVLRRLGNGSRASER